MARLVSVALMLSGCVLPSEFDKFGTSAAPADASAPALDGGGNDRPGMDASTPNPRDAEPPTGGDARTDEPDAHSSSEQDAGINGPDGSWCFDCARAVCPNLGEPSFFVPDAKALCPAGSTGSLSEMGPCRVSCRRVPGSTGSKDGACWDCQVPVCGELGHVPEDIARCPNTTQGYNMGEGPCRVPCE